MKEKLISIIVPCFNEEKTIPIFADAIHKTEEKMRAEKNVAFEYIFVDDGSADATASIIKSLAREKTNVKYVIFSRNFGKEAAILAGLKKSRGDYVAVMDADLQDPPSLLPQMYEAVSEEKYDAAAARRVDRSGEPPIRSFFARLFYKLINKISQIEIMDGARDYRLMSRRMVQAILEMSEYNRFSKGIFSWVGFQTKWIEYKNAVRVAGETKWSFYKLFKYSLDGLEAFSTVPLALPAILGILFCFVSLILFISSGVKSIAFAETFWGYGAMMGMLCMFSGLILLCVGIQGQYLAKTYMETKKRPIYICKEESCDAEEDSDLSLDGYSHTADR